MSKECRKLHYASVIRIKTIPGCFLGYFFFCKDFLFFILLLTSLLALLCCLQLRAPPSTPFLAGKRMGMQLTLLESADVQSSLQHCMFNFCEHSGILLCNQFDFWKLSNFSAETISRVRVGGVCQWENSKRGLVFMDIHCNQGKRRLPRQITAFQFKTTFWFQQ